MPHRRAARRTPPPALRSGAEGLIAEHLEPLTQEDWFNTNDAERNLLLLRDLPGYDARLTLRAPVARVRRMLAMSPTYSRSDNRMVAFW